MTKKKGHQNFLKKVVLTFFGQMCSGEFFLKHALSYIHVVQSNAATKRDVESLGI